MNLRIAVVPERLGAVMSPCGSIRLAAFFDAIRVVLPDGCVLRYLIPEEITAFRPNVIVWQRVAMDVREVATVAELAQRSDVLLVYDLDDNLFDLDDEAERLAYSDRLRAVEESLRVADQVWCSTSLLAERVGGMTRSPPRIMANALDPELWGETPEFAGQPPGSCQLLYMGTRTHAADLDLLTQAMDFLESSQPGRFRLDIVGVASDYPSRPWVQVLQIPSHIGASYPAFVHWLRRQKLGRFGVAPLLSSPFNDCKSCIKVMDYAALGAISIVSDVPAYAELRPDQDLVKTENSPLAWAQSIDRLLSDRVLQTEILANSRAMIGRDVFARAVQLRADAIREGSARW